MALDSLPASRQTTSANPREHPFSRDYCPTLMVFTTTVSILIPPLVIAEWLAHSSAPESCQRSSVKHISPLTIRSRPPAHRNVNFPNKIILSREKEELIKIFENKVPEKLKEKCFQISKMSKKEQENILGQKDVKLKDALNRKYTLPFLFKGNKNEKNKLLKVLNSNSLTLQEGGRVLNLCDNINKVKSMNRVIKILKKTEDKIKTIAVGDNYNDLDMLKSCDIPCLVFNDQFIQDQINIDNLIFSNKPSPEGWADVIKTALLKLDY